MMKTARLEDSDYSDRHRRLIPIKEFATLISRSVREVWRMVARGILPDPIKQGRRSFFLLEDLEAYLEKLKEQRS